MGCRAVEDTELHGHDVQSLTDILADHVALRPTNARNLFRFDHFLDT